MSAHGSCGPALGLGISFRMRYLHTNSRGVRFYIERDVPAYYCKVAWSLAHVAKWLIVLGEKVFSLSLRYHPGIKIEGGSPRPPL